MEPLAERADLKAAYSHAFLSSIDKAMQPKAKDRWQTTDEWLAAPDAEAAKDEPQEPTAEVCWEKGKECERNEQHSEAAKRRSKGMPRLKTDSDSCTTTAGA